MTKNIAVRQRDRRETFLLLPRFYLDFLTGGEGISVVSGGGRVRGEDLNLSAILMYIVSMISSI